MFLWLWHLLWCYWWQPIEYCLFCRRSTRNDWQNPKTTTRRKIPTRRNRRRISSRPRSTIDFSGWFVSIRLWTRHPTFCCCRMPWAISETDRDYFLFWDSSGTIERNIGRDCPCRWFLLDTAGLPTFECSIGMTLSRIEDAEAGWFCCVWILENRFPDSIECTCHKEAVVAKRIRLSIALVVAVVVEIWQWPNVFPPGPSFSFPMHSGR